MTFDKLFPAGVLKKIPNKPPTEADPVVYAKLFYPDFGWTWYVMSVDPSLVAYCYVEGFEKECGDVSIQELLETKGKLGYPIERDLYWKPKKLSEVRQ